mmetsp:Transcript_12568/g.18209  ORF Transcript_12568/g.18209 Transcript_12568/m.18209 type:complete len:167 (-) Transcript_12568:99-599(-)
MPTIAESCASTTGKVVLITGTGGFIGFHTAKALKKRGDGVLGIDNFNSYYPVALKRARAKVLEEEAGVVTVEVDLNNYDELRKLMDEHKFTHILNLAAQAGVRYATKDPYSYVNSNIAGFVQLLKLAASWALKDLYRFTFLNLLGEVEGCHVWSPPRAIDCEETQT